MTNLTSETSPALRGNTRRWVGIDVRPRSFGFIVLEDLSVLDCGTRSCERLQFSGCLGHRFQRILRAYVPAAIVMRTHRQTRNQNRRALMTSIRSAARASGVAVADVPPTAVRTFFLSHRARTKYEIARVVARFLPELAWKLPPQRKLWEKEQRRMSIFDAAAVALAYISPSTADSQVSIDREVYS